MMKSNNDIRKFASLVGLVVALVTSAETVTLGLVDEKADAVPNAARVKEIAGWLPEKPRSMMASITDRAAWEALGATKEGRETVKRAEALLKEPVPVLGDYGEFLRNGNRTRYEKPYFARMTNLQKLVFAECFENRGRFLGKIVEYLTAFCDERSWSSPAWDRELTNWNGTLLHGDLCSTERAFLLATTVAVLESILDPALVTRIKAECKRRIFDNYLDKNAGRMTCTSCSGNWWIHARENWNAVCNANVIRAALTIVESREERAAFAESGERTAKYYLESLGADGYCSEGMGYWTYGFGHHLSLGLALRDATDGKLDIFAHPRNRASVEYAYGYQIAQGVCPHFADGSGRPRASTLALARQICPDLADSRALAAPIVENFMYTSLRGFGREPKPIEPTRDVLPIRSWFPSAQVLICRERKPSFGFAIKGGNNRELHNHNDVGSYVVVLDGKVFSGDVGGEVYTKRTFSADRYVAKVLNSYGHPVPRVANALQPFGREYAAKVLSKTLTDERDEIVLDLKGAYAVSNLVSLVRTATFDRVARTVTIRDRVRFSEPSAFEVPVITQADVYADYKKGVYTLQLPDVKSSVGLAVTATGGDWHLSSELIENPQRKSPVRLAAVFDRPIREGEITFVYSAK